MEILNKTALKEAIELIERDIKICESALVSIDNPEPKKYIHECMCSLENILCWLKIHC